MEDDYGLQKSVVGSRFICRSPTSLKGLNACLAYATLLLRLVNGEPIWCCADLVVFFFKYFILLLLLLATLLNTTTTTTTN